MLVFYYVKPPFLLGAALLDPEDKKIVLWRTINPIWQTQEKNRVTWDVTIPKINLHPGRNTLEFNFDIHPNEESCKQYFLSKAWGAIYADTKLAASFANQLPPLKLSQFPAPFDTGSMVVLPVGETFNGATLVNGIMQLAQHLQKNPLNTSIMDANTVTEAKLAAENVILIGNSNTNVWLKNALQSPADKGTATEEFAMVQIIHSPWNNDKVALIISATNDQAMALALNLLTDIKVREKLNTDTVMIYADGHYVELNAQVSKDSPKTKSDSKQGIRSWFSWLK